MGRDVPVGPCPCGSERTYDVCCGPLHRGRPAPSAERLMRSRYTAYALGDARYVMNTTDPEGPHHRADRGGWKAELVAWCQSTAFDGLEVLEQSESGDDGFVHFRATLRAANGTIHVMEERSRFRRRHGRWLYTDAGG